MKALSEDGDGPSDIKKRDSLMKKLYIKTRSCDRIHKNTVP
jgi:hypothetical protein